MKKRCFFLFLPLACTLLSAIEGQAGPPQYRFDPQTLKNRELVWSSTRAGYTTFQSRCKSCHFRGNSQGASFLHTESKTMRGWNRIFYEKYPRCYADGAWKGLSEQDLVRLNDYLYMYAMDADNPFCVT